MSSTEGYEALEKLAKTKIEELVKKLVEPKLMPSEQKIEDVIAIRSEIKGINWFINEVNKIKQKMKDV